MSRGLFNPFESALCLGRRPLESRRCTDINSVVLGGEGTGARERFTLSVGATSEAGTRGGVSQAQNGSGAGTRLEPTTAWSTRKGQGRGSADEGAGSEDISAEE
jgi:hypothetical protein